MQNGESFFGEKHGKIAIGLNFAPKIIPDFYPFELKPTHIAWV